MRKSGLEIAGERHRHRSRHRCGVGLGAGTGTGMGTGTDQSLIFILFSMLANIEPSQGKHRETITITTLPAPVKQLLWESLPREGYSG